MSVIELTVDPTAHNHGPFPCGACAVEWLREATPAQRAAHEALLPYTGNWDADQCVAIAIDLADEALAGARYHLRMRLPCAFVRVHDRLRRLVPSWDADECAAAAVDVAHAVLVADSLRARVGRLFAACLQMVSARR